MKLNFKELAQEIEEEIINWRRELHQIPETELELPKTASYLMKELDKIGLEVTNGLAKSGLMAIIEGTNKQAESKTFAIRADMDALPITEETELSFASQHQGNMHACGHDAHMAMALGAAKLLYQHRDQLVGDIKILFQPGEEGPGGAKPMIEAGVLDNVDAIIGLHIGSIFEELDNGEIGISYGATMASMDKFSIEVQGQGGHGALPNTTVDPVVISSSIVQELQTLISREISPTNPGVITVGEIHGGTAYNVIPEKVELTGTTRFIHEEDRQQISKRMEELTENVATGRRGKIKFDYQHGHPPLRNNRELTEYVATIAKEVVGAEKVVKIEEPTMGGEDMAYFLEEVPGTFFFLGSAKEIEGKKHPHHHPKFDLDESTFWKGTALLAAVSFNWLKEN
ncbi:M20 metallopeptidase family protein [Fuchsiella alkaliacetigena]|uniref:M20 metallopeptidase family protein n=1 Tax=Fuchsiella alkaliacetigena TaxID=957042 RepID=UPI00200AC87D|nr:M20 family metallopeptidase [Fuchsiella alkaliacetigena]MCK8825830.1 M20 family metallopeptidase [Fuchsiella alkaliacetigena]